MVDAKLLVYKKYEHIIDKQKIILQHEYEDFDDVAKFIAYQMLSSYCTFVKSAEIALEKDLPSKISDYPAKSLTVKNIKQLCLEVFERIKDTPFGSMESKR